MKRPLFLVGLIYLAGTAAAFLLPWRLIVPIFLTLGLGAIGCIGIAKSKRAAIIMAGLSVAMGMFWVYQSKVVFPLWDFEGQTVLVEGLVEDVSLNGYGAVYSVKGKIGGRNAKIILYTYEEPNAQMGDSIRTVAEISPSERTYEWGNNIFLHGLAKAPIEKIILPKTLSGCILSLRANLLEMSDKLYRDPVRSMMQGMLFGYKKNIEPEIKNIINISGAAHILSVSGLHVSIMAAFLLKAMLFVRIRRKWALRITIPIIIIYMALTGFTPSATRAGIMAILHCIAQLTEQFDDSLTSLGFSVLCIIIFSPYYILNAGFLLSCSSTLGIILYARELADYIAGLSIFGKLPMPQGGFIRGIISCVATTLATYPFSVPILLLTFQSVPAYAVVTSVLSIWAVGPVLVIGFASLLLGYINFLMPITKILVFAAGILCRWILIVAKLVSSFLFAEIYSNDWKMLFWSVFCAAIFLFVHFKIKKRLRSEQVRIFSFALCCCIFAAIPQMILLGLSRNNSLHITPTEFALVLTKNGKGAVIGDIKSEFEAEEIELILSCEGVKKPQILLCNSASLEESSGMSTFLEQTGSKTCIVPQKGRYLEFVKAATDQELYELAPLKIEILDGIILETKERKSTQGIVRYDISIYAGNKAICKTSQKYDIIREYSSRFDAVFDGDNEVTFFTVGKDLEFYADIAGRTVLKVGL